MSHAGFSTPGKHFSNVSFECFVSACWSAAFACVDGKHCMQMAHFKSMLLVLFSFPDAPPPPPAALSAFAWFLARDIAVFCALPPPMISGSYAAKCLLSEVRRRLELR
eukprot:gnl/TRDRNA2_/TRDRNA2_178778_c0_seq1.p2 gnl/TRDRNA2_/TRDRNA2_178778_c0~~gnl/TRDRNA2_/TRDRNA2_178778_c0_seq1.p2  ORF type:complete len:108 (-),score=21.60 gnl/TRDRNA2_/TRDRNA2_178778_c0_seq1:66-389(-)